MGTGPPRAAPEVGPDADHRRTESATIAHVAFDQFDLWLVEMSGAPTVAGEHANGEASRL